VDWRKYWWIVVIFVVAAFIGGNKKTKLDLKSSKRKSEIKRIRLVNLRIAQKARMVKLRKQRSQKKELIVGSKP